MNYEYCDGFTHTIKKGDTLYEISRKHNVPLALLLRANPYVDVFNLQVGDTICIPSGNNQTAPSGNNQAVPYPVNTMPQSTGREETQGSPAAINNSNSNTMNENNVDMGNSTKVENDNMKEKTWIKYIVKPGDTLDDILSQMTGSMDEFVERNGLSSIYMLPGIAYYICKEKK